jgi:hypothetical protein
MSAVLSSSGCSTCKKARGEVPVAGIVRSGLPGAEIVFSEESEAGIVCSDSEPEAGGDSEREDALGACGDGAVGRAMLVGCLMNPVSMRPLYALSASANCPSFESVEEFDG